MKIIPVAASIAWLAMTLATVPAQSSNKDLQLKCDNTKEQIRRLRSKMRQGYTARQGIRMDDQMRQLKKKRSQYCR